MAATEDTNRFNIPVEKLIQELIAESHPELNAAPGSAFYDTLVSTSAVLFQHFRDYSKVIQRNQSLSNYAAMLPEELDRLAANYGVQRQQGLKARGSQRLTFPSPRNVSVTPATTFTDDAGHVYRPTSTVSLTELGMTANVIAATGEYYLDVLIEASVAGADSTVAAGAVNSVTGVAGVLRTFNPSDMTTGIDPEGNAQLYAKTLSSISNRDLVKATGIEAAILSAFPAVRQVKVVGYGDEEMTRDVVTTTLADQAIFERSFAQKVNLPLNGSGEVQWTNDDGSTITAPVGGFVGAIVDLVGRDFSALQVAIGGSRVEYIAAQQNFTVHMLDSADTDSTLPFTVTRTEEVPVESGGTAVKVLRMDRPFADTTPITSSNFAQFPYSLRGFFATNHFHTGGKVDVYVDSLASESREVIISNLPAVNAETTDISEIPLTATYVDDVGNNLLEGGIGFVSPILSISKIEQLDPANTNTVLRTLTPDVHYALISVEQRGQYTAAENDVLVVRGSETDTLTGQVLPLFVGGRIRVTYRTSPDVPAIQLFVDDASRRDLTKDIQVHTPAISQVDVELAYTADVSQQDVHNIVSEYIKTKAFGDVLTVQEILTTLAFFGVVDVTLPVTLRSQTADNAGSFTFVESPDRIQLSSAQIFEPVASLSITKL